MSVVNIFKSQAFTHLNILLPKAQADSRIILPFPRCKVLQSNIKPRNKWNIEKFGNFRVLIWHWKSYYAMKFPVALGNQTLHPKTSGGRLNKKDGLTRYGDSHVKDKTS